MAIIKEHEILSGVVLNAAYMRISSYSCENINNDNSRYRIAIDVYANKKQREIEQQSESMHSMAQKQLSDIRAGYTAESPNSDPEIFNKMNKLSEIKRETRKASTFEVVVSCCEDATRKELYEALSKMEGWESSTKI